MPGNPVNPANNIELLQQGASHDVVQRYSNLNSVNPFKGPTARSLFYEAGKRNPGKYGQFLFYALGNNENKFVDAYYRSESSDFNRSVSSLKAKNPSAGFLVSQTADLDSIASSYTRDITGLPATFEQDIIGGLAAPYYWKDFLYCKYYGAIPNNYMITLRRFPTPVLDNLSVPDSVKQSDSYSKEGAGRPVAQAVTWFGGNSGNTLNTLIQFTTGMQWDEKTQTDIVETEAFSKGMFQDLPYQWFSAAARAASGDADAVTQGISNFAEGTAIAFDPLNQTVDGLRYQGLRDRAKNASLGVMSEFIWVPLDVVLNTHTRGMGLSFLPGTLDIVFEYELTSVGEVNTKAAMLDMMANLLSIGTNYGNFLTPDTRYKSNFPAFGFPGGDDGLATFYRNPLQFILDYGDKLVNPVSTATGSEDEVVSNGEVGEGAAITDSQSALAELKAALEKLGTEQLTPDVIKELSTKFGTGVSNLLKLAVTESFITNWQVPASLLTGAPVGEWHLTIGNPCNPIAMIGNLICNNLKIEFGDTLGPDDFPTSLKATFSLTHGRDRERGEIESMFNRGDGRLYASSASTSASVQSFSAFSDVNGNVMTENTANQYMTGDAFNTTLPDQLGPNDTEE